MAPFKPFPAHPLIVQILKDQTGLTEEEALQPAYVRQFFDEQAALFPVREALRDSKTIQVNDRQVTLTIVRPKGSEGKVLPIIMFLHGGGMFMGSIKTHAILVHELAIRTPAVVVNVDYSLSPEVKHPIALQECYAALCWIKDNAASIQGDINRLAVVGDSAGGNLTTAVAALAKEKGLDSLIKAQVLLYPMLSTDFETKSYVEHQNNSFLPRKTMRWVWDSYLTEDTKANRFAVPQLATKEQLQGLPPALVITAENDVLRDDGETYAKKLRKAGVKTLSLRYNGERHGFFTESPLSPAASAGIEQIVYFLGKILSNKQSASRL